LAAPIFINGRFLAQPLAGVQRYATEMSRALAALNPDRVTLLAPPGIAQPSALPARIVGRRGGQIWEQVELPRFAKTGVLVNLGNTAPMFSGRQIAVLHDAAVFSTPEAYSRKFRAWYKTLHAVLARNRTRLVTVSEFSRADLARHLRIPPSRITVISEGADHMARIVPDQSVLLAHGLTARKYVLVVGTLAAHKNLAALDILAERLAARGMVLAVTGAFGAAAFQAGGDQKLPAAARYLGRVSDAGLKALYTNAACFVFPSLYEGFGLPAVEAMECGCAVIAADIPALRETCGAAAQFCDPASPAAIADTVMRLLKDPARLTELREAARSHVAPMTWANAAAALTAIIDGG
jgi:glycosyltransferase involved in cell wall biosynthesis